ncbi:Uncharacterised protein [Mycobacteroides abscessus subsp. abscessus]|nr:Uncharacterised protein [Mycobacteroides abscessus subsp. abscessus]
MGELALVGLGVVGLHDTRGAVLLVAVLARGTFTARVDEAADADAIADLVPGHLIADSGDRSGDLVSWHDGVGGAAPFVAGGMDVGVADPGEGDVDQDILRAEVPALDGGLR